MNIRSMIILMILLLPSPVRADVGIVVGPLSCGIFDEMIKPFVQEELDTQHVDPQRYTMEMRTKSGKLLTVKVHNVSSAMPGERNNVTVLVDGKPFAKTSHQDVPVYLEVHIDGVKYRIICVRAGLWPEVPGPAWNGTQGTPTYPAR